MTAVTKFERTAPIPSEMMAAPDPLMAGIIKAASDPKTDVEKLERLMNLYQVRAVEVAQQAFVAALAEAQNDLPTVNKGGTVDLGRGGKGYTFAKWEDINDAIKPVLHRHGFTLNFKIASSEKTVTVTGLLRRGGHTDETTMTLPFDTSGAKNPVQAMGSSISYGKRYIANALLNLTSRDGMEGDDDGRQAIEYERGPETITPAEVSHLEHLLSEPDSPTPKIFCRFFKIEKLADLPARKWDEAVAEIAHFKTSRKGAA